MQHATQGKNPSNPKASFCSPLVEAERPELTQQKCKFFD